VAVQQRSERGDNSNSPVTRDTLVRKTVGNRDMQVSTTKPAIGVENNPPSGQVGNIIGKLASEIQNNPAMESRIRNQLAAELNDTYDSFAEEYTLSPENKAALINLLTEKQMETLDMASQI
jgi:hypothetical protein